MTTKINSFTGEYYFLSNFYETPVTYNGITFLNNEAAFQAQKCKSRAAEEPKVSLSTKREMFADLNASEAKKLGRKVSLRSDWEAVKIGIMKEIVQAKFEQHPELAEKLLQTDTAYLEEGNTWGDRVWGTVDGQGANNLGRILMQVREILRERQISMEK